VKTLLLIFVLSLSAFSISAKDLNDEIISLPFTIDSNDFVTYPDYSKITYRQVPDSMRNYLNIPYIDRKNEFNEPETKDEYNLKVYFAGKLVITDTLSFELYYCVTNDKLPFDGIQEFYYLVPLKISSNKNKTFLLACYFSFGGSILLLESTIDEDLFIKTTEKVNNWATDDLGWVYNYFTYKIKKDGTIVTLSK